MISRRSTMAVCAALVAGMAVSAFAIEYNERRLVARLDGEFLHVSAPNFSFLNGKTEERLKDGTTVAFIAQLTVSTSPNYLMADKSSWARFAVSYDIWGERFAVTKFIVGPDQKLSKSHLSRHEAEAWCFDNLVINRADLPADRPFYLHLDLRMEDPQDQTSVIGDRGISIKGIMEKFSQPVRGKQAYPLLESGPLRLEELQKGMHE